MNANAASAAKHYRSTTTTLMVVLHSTNARDHNGHVACM